MTHLTDQQDRRTRIIIVWEEKARFVAPTINNPLKLLAFGNIMSHSKRINVNSVVFRRQSHIHSSPTVEVMNSLASIPMERPNRAPRRETVEYRCAQVSFVVRRGRAVGLNCPHVFFRR